VERWRKIKQEEREAKRKRNSPKYILDTYNDVRVLMDRVISTWIGKSMPHVVDSMYQERNVINDEREHILAIVKALDDRQLIGLGEQVQVHMHLMKTIDGVIDQVEKEFEDQEKVLKP
jgi:hypothetical protein